MLSPKEAEQLPLSHDIDILVVGGGPAGVSAAFAAARMGAKTLIVEQFNCLGGVAGAGGHGHMCLYSEWWAGRQVVGGITWEIPERIVELGYGVFDGASADFEVEGLKLLLEQMAEECGCGLLYHTFFCDTVVEDGTAAGAVVQNKSGRSWIKAKQVIDCTGDGDVAFHAGCSFGQGDDENGNCQPMTLMFTIGGVDWDNVKAWRTSYGMTEVWHEAQQNGDMRPYQDHIMGFWWTPTRPDQVGINFTHVNFADSTKAMDLTQATIEARKQAYESIEVFRKYVPGMEGCYMISTPNTIGLRESRRIHGEYTLTVEDVKNSRPFDDSIGYGSFYIDIHGTSGPGMDQKTWRPPKGFKYQIPYRILVPKAVDNLLVAGRCVSADHIALGSLRVMPTCGVMGQAAGVSAMLSLKNGSSPRSCGITELRAELRRQNCILDQGDVDTANTE